MGDRFAGPRIVAANDLVERGQRAVGGRSEQIREPDRRAQPEVALPVLWPRSPILTAVGEAEEEAGNLLLRQQGMRLRQPIAAAAIGSDVARIGGVLSGDDENPARHVPS